MSAFFAGRRGQTDAESQEAVTVLPVGQPVGFDTVMGSNSETEGTFFSSGNVRMDGKFTGTLEIEGNILVGESADIRADINARNISIAGTVRGNVAGNKVQLLRTGRIWGDISASALTTEEGAFIDGKITMMGHSATQPPTDEDVIDLDDSVRVLDEGSANLDDDGNELIEEAEIISNDGETAVIDSDEGTDDESKG
ncbi:MAG: polymer-forming cytoskeletal protein [Chloroflexi bacterium]|nr:polymer-forming cytoskeletal protein [Chloroflexota bacterium]